MSQWNAFARLHQESDKAEGRDHPRFVASSLNCEKGVVSDFSATGLRIVYRKCPKFGKGDTVQLDLYSMKGMHQCSATVMWIDRKSRKQTQVGFRFTDPEMAKKMRIFEFGFDSLSEGMLDR